MAHVTNIRYVVVVDVPVIRVLAYMMPADQENTNTPHFDLVKCGY